MYVSSRRYDRRRRLSRHKPLQMKSNNIDIVLTHIYVFWVFDKANEIVIFFYCIKYILILYKISKVYINIYYNVHSYLSQANTI